MIIDDDLTGKPCPFCGSEDIGVDYSYRSRSIYCKSCGCRTQFYGDREPHNLDINGKGWMLLNKQEKEEYKQLEASLIRNNLIKALKVWNNRITP